MLKNKIFKYQEGGNVNVAPKPLYKPNAKLDNNRVVIPDIYNTRMGELLPLQLRNQWETSGMNLEDANTYRQGQKEMQSIMNRPSTFLERLERAPSETWEDIKSLVPNRTNVAPKGYKDLRGYQKSGTIGSSLGTRTWNTTDNSTVTKQMNKPYVGARTSNNATNIHYTTPASIRATTDADKANAAYQQRNKEYWESKPSGQLATWADKKLQNWNYNMGSVPGESLLATPLRMLSSVGHSANRYSEAIENKENRGSNILKGFGNQAMASLDGLMLADGLGAAGSKLSTAAIKDATKNTYKLNPLANKLNNPNTSYRVAGMDALEDFNSSRVLRSKPLANTVEGEINVGSRPTAFPSFNKGSADLRYLPEEGGVVFETNLPTFKRGEINPVTGQPIKGRHYAHRVIGETGEAVSIIPAKDITVREATPHWLRGYRKLDVNGNPINVNYKLIRDKDRMMSGPIPTFSWKPYESSADDIISSQNMDTKLQSMYDRANKQRIDDLINDRPYDPDFNEASFLNNLAGTMQIHRMEVAPGRSLFTLNPEGAMFSTEGGTMRNLEDIMEALRKDHVNNAVK